MAFSKETLKYGIIFFIVTEFYEVFYFFFLNKNSLVYKLKILNILNERMEH